MIELGPNALHAIEVICTALAVIFVARAFFAEK